MNLFSLILFIYLIFYFMKEIERLKMLLIALKEIDAKLVAEVERNFC